MAWLGMARQGNFKMTRKEYTFEKYDVGKDITAWEKEHGKGRMYSMSKEKWDMFRYCSINPKPRRDGERE